MSRIRSLGLSIAVVAVVACAAVASIIAPHESPVTASAPAASWVATAFPVAQAGFATPSAVR